MEQHNALGSRLTRWFVQLLRARVFHAALACSAVLLLALLLVVSLAHASSGTLQSTATAHVVVQFGDHDLAARSISFSAPTSGLRALELTGLRVVTTTTQYGAAVCSIEGVGCPASNCFCDPERFWGYSYWDGAAWQGYMVGPDSSTVGDGAVEGWRWGAWGSTLQSGRQVTAALHALDWLRPRQSPADGGYGGDSSTIEAQLAIGAADYTAGNWRAQAQALSLMSYQLAHAALYASQDAGQAGKLAVAQVATNACFPHGALLPTAYYNPMTGAYAAGAGPDSWAILGSAALSQTVPTQASQYLKGLAQVNGGWEWSPGWGADTNATALALQALVAAGEPVTSTTITHGLAYLKSAQNGDGGFPYSPGSPWGTDSDANSTAYVVQALLAAGQDPVSVTWQISASDPISYLLSLQLADGSFEWQKGNGANQLATEQALVALLGRPFPLRVAQLASCNDLYLPLIIR